MTNAQRDGSTAVLYMAMEVGEKEWQLAFTDGRATRLVSVAAWDDGTALAEAIERAKAHLGLAATSAVRSCYEAGRCAFSLHRYLESLGVANVVVDSSSIEVARGRKHRKTDRLDVERLLRLLVRYDVYGEKTCWQVCRVPTVEQEAARRADREHERLTKERTGHLNRLRALLAQHGVRPGSVRRLSVGAVRDWAGEVLAAPWQEEIARELDRLRLVEQHLATLKKQREAALQAPTTACQEKAMRLTWLVGIGQTSAWALATQFFWRSFENVRQVGAAAGLTGCPYDSGASQVEQGISKAGSRRVRTLMIEVAWMWLRWQPQSALSRWFRAQFARGKRARRIGIVALARKLLVALWKYLEWGLIPERARLTFGTYEPDEAEAAA